MPPTPFSPGVAKAAAEWLALSMDTAFHHEDAARPDQWRQAHPEHERAWQHINGMRMSMQHLNGHAAYKSLSILHSPSRRSALKAIAWLGITGGSGYVLSQSETWQQQMADYSTRTGEMKTFALADGTQISMNTYSAIDVKMNASERRITLLRGEIMVTTGHLPAEHRALKLHTKHGSVEPIGTRFTLRVDAQQTKVAVLEGAVKVMPADGTSQTVRAGAQTSFSSTQAEAISPVTSPADAWSKGLLFANAMRLADLLDELARYRAGFIYCDAAVADLRISGVFPLKDTTQALEAIANSLPVSIVYRTRYWVRMSARKRA